MLPLWPDQLLIAISPTQLSLLRLRGWPGRDQIIDKYKQPIASPIANQPIWQPVLDALQICLSKPAWQKANAKIVISNSLIWYTLLPWSEVVLNADEEQKLVKIKMDAIFGYDQHTWEVSLAEQHYGQPRLACAMNNDMLSTLRQLADASKLNIHSIQPHLVAAINYWQNQLKGKQLYFLMADGAKLVMAYIENGHLKNIRLEQVNGTLTNEMLTSSYKREVLINDFLEQGAPIYLFTPNQKKLVGNDINLQKFQVLNLPVNYIQKPEAFLAAAC